ncbi:CapA family protein [Bacillus timonensis]|nr:CapA family protein [Bacillus timonensis]
MKKATFKLTFLGLFICLLLISVSGYFLLYLDNKKQEVSASTQPLVVKNHLIKQSTTQYKSYTSTVTFAAVGDILIHSTVYNDAKTSDGGYNFKPMIAGVRDLMVNADVTFANQETINGGTEIGLSTYPTFNSPFEVADALQDAGVDIVSIANNHTIDRGERAVLNATDYYNKIGMLYVGGYRNNEDKEKIRVINSKGIKLGFLAYTYGTNGIPVPKGKDYLVNLIDVNLIKADVEKAKKVSDVVIVSMHWGNEYQLYPSDQQKNLAQELADAGVDVIIGHHPHVLQPMEWLERSNGGKTFVIYSLGNFLSGQMWDYKDIGGVLYLEFTKEINKDYSEISIGNPHFTPTYVTNTNQRNFRIVPLKDAGTVGLKNADSKYIEMNEHMYQWIKGQ